MTPAAALSYVAIGLVLIWASLRIYPKTSNESFMSEYQQRDNSGVLFKNHRKEKDSHPDYKGNGRINGRDVEISAWIKEGKRGKFMSLSFQPPRDRQPAPNQPDRDASSVASGNDGGDSSVPF
jgi:hypothetical protein